jgi:hypothetical protein
VADVALAPVEGRDLLRVDVEAEDAEAPLSTKVNASGRPT